jgi:hypothetical protein
MIAKIFLSRQTTELVKRLLSTGLYGASISEVCQRIVEEKLRDFIVVRKLRVRLSR